MKRQKQTVEVTYKFEISYEHPDHLKRIIADLEKNPIFSMGGAGVNDKGNGCYSYSCERVGKGAVKE